MTCPYKYWVDGHRTYGSDIPPLAQGEYFPGDEPGFMCRKTDDGCHEDDPAHCPVLREQPVSITFDYGSFPGECVYVTLRGTKYQVLLDRNGNPDPEMDVTFSVGATHNAALSDDAAGKITALVAAAGEAIAL